MIICISFCYDVRAMAYAKGWYASMVIQSPGPVVGGARARARGPSKQLWNASSWQARGPAATLAANTDPLWAAKRALHSIRALYRTAAPSDASDARHGRPESSRIALRNGQRAQCAWSLGADLAYSRVQERAARGHSGGVDEGLHPWAVSRLLERKGLSRW